MSLQVKPAETQAGYLYRCACACTHAHACTHMCMLARNEKKEEKVPVRRHLHCSYHWIIHAVTSWKGTNHGIAHIHHHLETGTA
jgi:hypothetical protein